VRVLLTTDAVGGVWGFSVELAKALSGDGIDVDLASMGPLPSESERAQVAALPRVRLHASDYRLEWMEDPWDDVRRAGDWLLAIAGKTKPDIVHLSGYAHAAVPWEVPVVVTAHSCVLSWWQAVRGTPLPAEWEPYRRAVASGLASADVVAAPTEWMLDRLREHYGEIPSSQVIPNGRSAADFLPGPKEPLVLAAVRLWDEAKNVKALCAASKSIAWPVRVAGEGAACGDGESIESLGPLSAPDLAAWYARASIFAHPSRYEPFGLAPLEAALAGCALVLSDLPSLREVWGSAAVFMDPDDPAGFAREVNALAGNPARRELLASRARARALRLSPAAAAAGYRKAYSLAAANFARTAGQPASAVSRISDALGRTSPEEPGRVVLFCHSLVSDWNHDSAHFLRGVVSELLSRGYVVRVFEPADAWSVQNLIVDAGEEVLGAFGRAYPALTSERYDPATLDLDRALDGARLVIVHEWNDPALVARIGARRAALGGGGFRLLFHDTHHRAVTDPAAMERFDLRHYDGVLAFGAVIRDVYVRRGWASRAWVWHEAADVRVFRPFRHGPREGDVVWIGNWGDAERTSELSEFLLEPVRALRLRARVYGVRYPEAAKQQLTASGVEYGGWLPNYEMPRVFGKYRATVHVPRRRYRDSLAGIPTMRPFEAMACGIPLLSSPWEDAEGLFSAGRDYVVVRSGSAMRRALRELLDDDDRAHELAANARRTILSRHTCGHRVDELLRILGELEGAGKESLLA